MSLTKVRRQNSSRVSGKPGYNMRTSKSLDAAATEHPIVVAYASRPPKINNPPQVLHSFERGDFLKPGLDLHGK